MEVAALISGGKDSLYATYISMQFGWKVKYLLAVIPKNIHSWMFHSINLHLLDKISKLIGIPLITVESKGEEEEELEDLRKLLENLDVEGIVSGAIASDYQRTRINHICTSAGLKSFTPIWHKNPENLLRLQIESGFKFLIVATAAEGLEKWLGAEISKNSIDDFIRDCKKLRVHLSGEGGEYETFVTECPLYRGRMEVEEMEWKREGDFSYVILRKVNIV